MAIFQLPLWAALAIYRQKDCRNFFHVMKQSCSLSFSHWLLIDSIVIIGTQRVMSSLKETDHWGPKNPAHRIEWKKFQEEKPHHHTSYSARLWYPKIPKRMTYDVSTLAGSNGSSSPTKESNHAHHQRPKVTSAPHSRSTMGHMENEIASWKFFLRLLLKHIDSEIFICSQMLDYFLFVCFLVFSCFFFF